jgi:hypothetical protein
MSVIDYYPISHQAVDFALATTLVNGQVSEIRVTLRTTAVIVDPLTFVTDNSLEQEILSKAGLDEELAARFDEATLVNTITEGPYYLYSLSFPVTTGGC